MTRPGIQYGSIGEGSSKSLPGAIPMHEFRNIYKSSRLLLHPGHAFIATYTSSHKYRTCTCRMGNMRERKGTWELPVQPKRFTLERRVTLATVQLSPDQLPPSRFHTWPRFTSCRALGITGSLLYANIIIPLKISPFSPLKRVQFGNACSPLAAQMRLGADRFDRSNAFKRFL